VLIPVNKGKEKVLIIRTSRLGLPGQSQFMNARRNPDILTSPPSQHAFLIKIGKGGHEEMRALLGRLIFPGSNNLPYPETQSGSEWTRMTGREFRER